MAVNCLIDNIEEMTPKDYFLNEMLKRRLTDCDFLVGTEYEIKVSNTLLLFANMK